MALSPQLWTWLEELQKGGPSVYPNADPGGKQTPWLRLSLAWERQQPRTNTQQLVQDYAGLAFYPHQKCLD